MVFAVRPPLVALCVGFDGSFAFLMVCAWSFDWF